MYRQHASNCAFLSSLPAPMDHTRTVASSPHVATMSALVGCGSRPQASPRGPSDSKLLKCPSTSRVHEPVECMCVHVGMSECINIKGHVGYMSEAQRTSTQTHQEEKNMKTTFINTKNALKLNMSAQISTISAHLNSLLAHQSRRSVRKFHR